MDTTIDDVLAAYDKEGYLLEVLNRSVKYIHKMSFGWVVATAKGTHLAKSFGGYNRRGSSLQAEAVGILSILMFVKLMAKHSNHTDLKIKYVTNNLEFVNRSKEHLKYEHP